MVVIVVEPHFLLQLVRQQVPLPGFSPMLSTAIFLLIAVLCTMEIPVKHYSRFAYGKLFWKVGQRLLTDSKSVFLS
jgi:hypothetical protein